MTPNNSNVKLGIIARADNTGLGNQTLNLCKMLKPAKVLLIDSTPFNKNEQHFERYENFNTDKVLGFPNKTQLMQWSKGLTHILTAETFYNDFFTGLAMRSGIKTFIQPNYEFSDYFTKHMTPPSVFLIPSYWKLNRFKEQFTNVVSQSRSVMAAGLPTICRNFKVFSPKLASLIRMYSC